MSGLTTMLNVPQHNRATINPSEIGGHREPAIPSQPAENAGGVETVTVQKAKFKGIIAGMMLGDGCLFKGEANKNFSLRLQHTIKQEEYLLHKAKILEELTSAKVHYIKPTDKKHPNWNVRCTTKGHPFYTNVRKIVYPHGKKQVTPTWLCWLNEEGLAIWYMDDGTLMKSYGYNKSGKRRIKSRHIKLCTQGFSYEENLLLRDFIQDRFGVNFKAWRDGKYYHLGASPREANKLFDIIRPFILPCMKYKLDMQYEQSNEGHS